MKIAVYGKFFEQEFIPYIGKFFSKLKDYKVSLHLYQPFLEHIEKTAGMEVKPAKVFTSNHDFDPSVDFMISIGGDGTFLETPLIIRHHDIPVIGINSGRLGFLANIAKEEISCALDAIMKKEFKFEYRGLLEIHSKELDLGQDNFALNEITFQKKDSSMITVDALVNQDFLASYWSDGLIISTPTGSTAYSLSVGGPIVSPEVNNFLISPIAPHNLTVRPIIVPDESVLKFRINSRDSEFVLSLDRRHFHIKTGIEVEIKKASFRLKLIKFEYNNFYNTLRNKLMWGADTRN